MKRDDLLPAISIAWIIGVAVAVGAVLYLIIVFGY